MTRLAVAPPWTAASSINLGRATPVIPIAIRGPSSPPCRPLLNEMVNAPRQQTAGAEIPIAPDAQLRQISRGFLPWRFADAGPLCAAPSPWAGIRKPSQTRTSLDVVGMSQTCQNLGYGEWSGPRENARRI